MMYDLINTVFDTLLLSTDLSISAATSPPI